MTPFEKIYDAFLVKVEDDEWLEWDDVTAEKDWYGLMQAALPFFKFPRVSLDYDENGFLEDLNNEEIQIIANYMKCEWLDRTINSWENVKNLYDERDFSQANLLDKLRMLLEKQEKRSAKLEANYYRSINYKPYDYRKLSFNE